MKCVQCNTWYTNLRHLIMAEFNIRRDEPFICLDCDCDNYVKMVAA